MMKNPIKVLLFMLIFAPYTISGASAITVDGNFTDWGFSTVNGFQDVDIIGNVTTGLTDAVYWSEEDGYVGSYGYVEPGYGGQSFDHEGLYLTEDDNNYYIGLMTGMSPGANYASWSSTPQYIGDIALDTGNGFDKAISLHHVRQGTFPIQSDIYTGVTAWENTTAFHPEYNPTPYYALDADAKLGIQFNFALHGDSYFYEFGINKSHMDLADGITAFVTMSCGNDWLETSVPMSVPEPPTILLLGTGLLIAIKLRKN